MAIDKDLEQALEALARREGKSGSELLGELLGGRAKEAVAEKAPLARSGPDDRELGRAEAIERHHANDFPGTPVVRYREDPYGETAEEAKERWLAEEAELIDGVHGLGGQSAGGIFGDAAVATSIYDPGAEHRALSQAGHAGSLRLARVLERIEQRLDAAEPARALPGGKRRQLGRGNR
jgi:hypothetical protein